MKKLLAIALVALLIVSGCSPKSADTTNACTAGVYTGESVGYQGGKITAEVTVSETAITSVTLTGVDQTESIGGVVLEQFGKKIVDAQSVEIDAIVGATQTSQGVINAVKAALDGKCDLTKLVAGETNNGVKETLTVEVDVVIIGAGGAGLTAAIEAATAGKKVVIVEVAPMAGGNSTRATGGMNAAKTEGQDTNKFEENAGVEKTIATAKEKFPELSELVATVEKQYADYQASPNGYFDSTELFVLDTLVGGGNLNNPELVNTLVGNSAESIQWLKTIGADLSQVGSFGGASVKRIHKPVNAEGKSVAVGSYLIPILVDAAKAATVEFLYETKASEIILTDGVATGVKATSATAEYTITAKAVVVATGGFGANAEMYTSYKPELNGFVTTNAPTIVGDGIKMVEAIGGALVDMEQIQIHPTVEQSTSALITEGLRGDGAILVNAEGKRFTDEVGTRNAVSADIIAQTDSSAYLIVDNKMVEKSSVIGGYIKSGLTVEGKTIEELAAAMNVDAKALAATIDTWNAAVDAKSDTEFNRTSFADKLDTGSFYAIKIAPGVHHTMGGVKINPNTEVLNNEGNVIPGLFAAGEVTGGIHGNNRLGGNAVADFIVFGRIAGQEAAAFAK